MTCERRALNPEQKQDAASYASDEIRSQALQQLLAQSLFKFDQTDKNSNGYLDFQELTASGGKNEKVLAKSISTLQGISNDEWLFENNGASKDDLNQLFNKARFTADQMRQARDIRETIGRNFNLIAPGDVINQRDLRTAINSGNFSRCDTAALRDTYDNFYNVGRGQYKAAVTVLRKSNLTDYVSRVENNNQLVFDVAKNIEF